MQTIKAVIEYMENGNSTDCPFKLAEVVDRLLTYSPKEYLHFWASLKEFENPKQMRANYVPQSGDDQKDVTITVVDETDLV
jgi:hypothetical protein